MSYVHKTISPDEKLISITRLHWIYTIEAVLTLVACFALGAVIDHYLYIYTDRTWLDVSYDMWMFKIDRIYSPFKWLGFGAGLAIFIPLMLGYISTEIGLTSQRLIHKKGLIFIQVQQLDLEDIRAEQVIHGWFGWIFGYGKLHFDCRFVHDMYLPAVAKPYDLIKAAHAARKQHPMIEYTEDSFEINMQALEHAKQRSQKKFKHLAEKIRIDFLKKS